MAGLGHVRPDAVPGTPLDRETLRYLVRNVRVVGAGAGWAADFGSLR